MTASDIALGAARRYMTDVLGAGYFRFSHELTEIAEQVAVDYNAAYPPRELVRLEPGY
jgi:hypothetical protein